jgi:hypothetical protein
VPNTLQFRRGALAGLPSLSAGEPGFTTDQFRLYVGSSGGNRLVGLFHNNAATAAPTVNDDAGDGYSVGSRWIDTTNDKTYVLVDSTVGAAVWQQTSGTGTTGTVAVDSGGTGRASHTAYAVLCGGTTSTGAQQSVASVGTEGQVLTSNGPGALPTFEDAATAVSGTVPNLIQNGGFEVWQRGTSVGSTSNDVYTADRWYMLQQSTGSTTTVQRATGTLGARYALQFGPTAGSSRRVGVAHIVEASDSIPYRGRTVQLQIKVKYSGSVLPRIGLLEWTGTADSVTSDVVSSWTDTVLTAGHFFLSSNITVVQTTAGGGAGSFSLITTSGTISSSCNNLIVIVWSDDVMTTSDSVTITECALYDGSDTRDWLPRPVRDELALCQRQLFICASERVGLARNADYLYGVGRLTFPTRMRAAPTMSGASFAANAGSAGTPQALNTTVNGLALRNSANNWTADAIVDFSGTFSAEL